jgi:hypothetical protein
MIAERSIAQTRRAAPVRRSPSNLAGGALIPAAPGPAMVSAWKVGKNKSAKKRCRKQQAQCVAAVSAYCSPQTDPLRCEDTYLPCCERFTRCNVEPAIACIYATFLASD